MDGKEEEKVEGSEAEYPSCSAKIPTDADIQQRMKQQYKSKFGSSQTQETGKEQDPAPVSWEGRFHQLRTFYSLYGHANPVWSPTEVPFVNDLATWLDVERSLFWGGYCFPQWQLNLLREMGVYGFGHAPLSSRSYHFPEYSALDQPYPPLMPACERPEDAVPLPTAATASPNHPLPPNDDNITDDSSQHLEPGPELPLVTPQTEKKLVRQGHEEQLSPQNETQEDQPQDVEFGKAFHHLREDELATEDVDFETTRAVAMEICKLSKSLQQEAPPTAGVEVDVKESQDRMDRKRSAVDPEGLHDNSQAMELSAKKTSNESCATTVTTTEIRHGKQVQPAKTSEEATQKERTLGGNTASVDKAARASKTAEEATKSRALEPPTQNDTATQTPAKSNAVSKSKMANAKQTLAKLDKDKRSTAGAEESKQRKPPSKKESTKERVTAADVAEEQIVQKPAAKNRATGRAEKSLQTTGQCTGTEQRERKGATKVRIEGTQSPLARKQAATRATQPTRTIARTSKCTTSATEKADDAATQLAGMSWSSLYMELNTFKNRFGNANPRVGHLALWLEKQRDLFRRGMHSSPLQIQMLRATGCRGFEEERRVARAQPPAVKGSKHWEKQLRKQFKDNLPQKNSTKQPTQQDKEQAEEQIQDEDVSNTVQVAGDASSQQNHSKKRRNNQLEKSEKKKRRNVASSLPCQPRAMKPIFNGRPRTCSVSQRPTRGLPNRETTEREAKHRAVSSRLRSSVAPRS